MHLKLLMMAKNDMASYSQTLYIYLITHIGMICCKLLKRVVSWSNIFLLCQFRYFIDHIFTCCVIFWCLAVLGFYFFHLHQQLFCTVFFCTLIYLRFCQWTCLVWKRTFVGWAASCSVLRVASGRLSFPLNWRTFGHIYLGTCQSLHCIFLSFFYPLSLLLR